MKQQRRSVWSAARTAIRGAVSTFRRERVGAQQQRAFKAAESNRLNADWAFAPIFANRELRVSLRRLRNNMREQAQNNDTIKKFLSMVVSNVPGAYGMTLRLAIEGRPKTDEASQQLIEEVKTSFTKWSCPEYASASGKLSFIDQQRLFIRTMARDGEVLIRKLVSDNPWGFSMKFIDVSWLDEFYNETLPNGNRVLMSVEVDQNDRPVAYWLTVPSGDYLFNARPKAAPFRQRVSASEFIHAFLVNEDESQARGLPWAHTALTRLRILAGYEEAELVAARVGACKMAWLLPPVGEDGQFQGTPETDSLGNPIPPEIIEEMQPGATTIAPPGYTVHDSAPTHPNTNYNQFIKGVLRGIAGGLEVSYNSLANDLEGVNYSSIRSGLLEERDVWRGLQQFMVDHFNHPVFVAWLRMAMLSGAINLSAHEVALVKDSWKPRGWPWVDPMNDVQATILAINNALQSRSDDADERGDDFFENIKTLKEENKALEEAGITIPAPPGSGAVNATPTADDKRPKDPEEETDDEESRTLPVF